MMDEDYGFVFHGPGMSMSMAVEEVGLSRTCEKSGFFPRTVLARRES